MHNGSEAVGRAPDPVGNVGVDHRCLQVAVAEEFLDGADHSGWRAGGTQVSAITDSVRESARTGQARDVNWRSQLTSRRVTLLASPTATPVRVCLHVAREPRVGVHMPGSADSAFFVEDRELREAVPARGDPGGVRQCAPTPTSIRNAR